MLIVLLVPLLFTAAVGAHHVAYWGASKHGVFCSDSPPHPVVPIDQTSLATAPGFTTDQVCWGSGIAVTRGHTYEATLKSQGDWIDLTLRTDVAGLPTFGLAHWIAWPLKRYWSGNWFAPVLRIGNHDGVEFLMTPAGPPGSYATANVAITDRFEPLPDEDVEKILKTPVERDGPRTATARFTAERDGELFLFVNDALALIPGHANLFYRNNHGSGTLVIMEVHAPADVEAASH